MKIEEVKKLDDGVSGIIIEGRIIRVLKPRESQYGWGQFIVIKDDTGEMGSNINIENEEAKYQGGEYVQVKGKVSHYVKNDKPNVSLNGNVVDEIVKVDEDVSQDKPQPTIQKVQNLVQEIVKEKVKEKVEEKEYTNNDYWHDKTLRDIENNKCIVRECAIKAVTELVNAVSDDKKPYIGTEKEYFGFADRIVDYIYETKGKITSEDITKEFGGETVELPADKTTLLRDTTDEPNPHITGKTKEEFIAQAKEIVKNPHLAEPVDDTMATVKQKKQTYGYINEEGKKIGGIVDSQYMTKEEVKSIGKADKLTKAQGIKYWDYWYGKEGEMGERDKRELAAKEKEGNPFVTEREPIEKTDKDDNASLSKDMIIDEIQAKRKELHLEDDKKFEKEIGHNTNFKNWTEKELTKLNELLKDWKPNWVTK